MAVDGWLARDGSNTANARRVTRKSNGEVMGAASSNSQTLAGNAGTQAQCSQGSPIAMRKLVIGTIALGMASRGAWLQAQQAARRAARRDALAPPAAPAPRWPDGRISFTGSPTDVGNWDGPANASIFFNMVNGKLVKPAAEPAHEQDGGRDSLQARHARALRLARGPGG